MRVLQLIDSLETGGAERVAVNMANMLSSHVEKSYLCTTRKEGGLKKNIDDKVNYVFLNKKKSIDLKAISKLDRFIKKEKITIVHAHSSSFFLATLIKIKNKKLKLVWHDHYGNSEFLEERKHLILSMCSRYFSCIFSVNQQLESWAKIILKHKNVNYFPNFATPDVTAPVTRLNGVNNKRIIHLANLRPQKDHITLLNAFSRVLETHSDWTLHCIGKDFNDDSSKRIKETIKSLKLKNSVFLYGVKTDISHILSQANIGVLSSVSEGLPLALLEYGLSNLAVICTNVGECSQVVENNVNGLVVDAKNEKQLTVAISLLIENNEIRNTFALAFNAHVENNYSYRVLVDRILNKYFEISKIN